VRLALLVALLVVSACGGSTAGSRSGQQTVSPAPSPSPTQSHPLLEVLLPGQVVLMDLTGNIVASTPQVPVASNGFVGLVPVGAGGDRAAYLETSSGVLWALHRDGHVERLATTPASYSQVLLSPDGEQWAWVEQTTTPDGQVHSRLHVGASGGDHVIQEVTDPDHALRPFRWDAAGLVVEREVLGRGRYVPFDPATGPVELVNPQTGLVQPLKVPLACTFEALAMDGTIVCQTQSSSGTTLTIITPGGASSTTTLPRPGFNSAGNISFKPDSSATTLVIGGDTWDATHANVAGQLTTAIVDIRSGGALQPLGPIGLAPAGGEDWVWLHEGSMVTMGWLHDPSSDSGVWLLSADGTAHRISSGQAFGVLN
jgi:YD repeat-containing protein